VSLDTIIFAWKGSVCVDQSRYGAVDDQVKFGELLNLSMNDGKYDILTLRVKFVSWEDELKRVVRGFVGHHASDRC
jgi:hypothetical protein